MWSVYAKRNQKHFNEFLTAVKMRQGGERGNFARIEIFLMLLSDSDVSVGGVGGLDFSPFLSGFARKEACPNGCNLPGIYRSSQQKKHKFLMQS